MQIVIDSVRTTEQFEEISAVRRQVFEKEWGTRIPELEFQADKVWHLAARTPEHGRAIGTLTVLETTADHTLHAGYALHFPENVKVARLTQLAVQKPYRGCGISAQLISEALSRIIGPFGFDVTWLVFNARRANSSYLVNQLGYSPSPCVLYTDYGLCRVLTRDEARRREYLSHGLRGFIGSQSDESVESVAQL